MQSLFFAFFALNILRCIWGRKLDMAFHASQKLLVVGCWLHRSSNVLVGVPLRDLMDQTPHLTGFCAKPFPTHMPGGCLQDAPPFVVEWLPTIGDVPEVDSAKAELPQWAGPDLFGGLQGTLMRAPPPS